MGDGIDMETIDNLVENNRNKLIVGSDLGIVDDISEEFLCLMKNEAQHLRTHGRVNYCLKFKKVFIDAIWKVKSGVKKTAIKTDFLLTRFRIYRDIFRPKLKKIYMCLRPQKKVRINRLFKLNDEEFIKELYRVFLTREADDEGFRHNLNVLQSGQSDRLDMISTFNDSLEGGRIPLKITGKYFERKKKTKQK